MRECLLKAITVTTDRIAPQMTQSRSAQSSASACAARMRYAELRSERACPWHTQV
jgi:hypothetical protein